MNPDFKPPTPDAPNDTPPSTPTSAGDEAALQAIEALETESNEISAPETPAPLDPMPSPTSFSQTPNPAPLSNPVITEPLVPTTPPVAEPTVPEPVQTPSALTDSLNEEAPTTPVSSESFQPFTQPKKSKKGIIILVSVFVLLILGAGGYFGWQYFQSQNTPAPAPATQTTQETTTPSDTEDSVNAAITDMETELSGLDDSEYSDTTLSDSTLYN